ATGIIATMSNRAQSLPRLHEGDGRTSRASSEGGNPAPLNATNLWGGPHDRPVHRERLEISECDGRGFDGEDAGRCDYSGPGSRQDLRSGHPRGGWNFLRGPPWGDLRIPRPERCGEDHDDQGDHDAHQEDIR